MRVSINNMTQIPVVCAECGDIHALDTMSAHQGKLYCNGCDPNKDLAEVIPFPQRMR